MWYWEDMFHCLLGQDKGARIPMVGMINWGSALVDIAIIFLALTVSVWQNNPRYLLLLLLAFCTGSYVIK